jgi:hypothetical protein
MNTTFWGPSGWKFLHTLTFIYPINPSFSDKVKMREFMSSLYLILPCKYCRASFLKYSNSLPIDEYLESRYMMIEWLYKIHNKVNKKLRAQGFCKHSNPDESIVTTIYNPILEHITKIINNESRTSNQRTQEAINYICNLGREFLGSIVFNYQGYFTNCHTSDEKVKIISVYQSFFNSIIPLICCYLSKLCKEGKECVSRYEIKKFKIRNILTHLEPYSKLITWFYKCDSLCSLEDMFKTQDLYEKHFEKHIVSSCNNPKTDNVKTCRSSFFKKAAPKTQKLINPVRTKKQ